MKTHPLFDVALPLVFAGAFTFACTESLPQQAPPVRAPTATTDTPEAGVVTTDDIPAVAQVEPAVLDEAPPPPPTLREREALVPADPNVDHFALGEQHLKDKKFDEATAAFRTALGAEDRPEIWAALGTAYAKSGERERAIECLEEAVSRDIDNVGARASLARLYLDAGNAEETIFHAQIMIKQGVNAQGHYLLGRGYMAQSMWKESMEAMEKVIELEPDNVYAHNNLGFAALQIGDSLRAVDALETILDLDGQKGYMMNNLGVAYERQDRQVEAYAAFARALELTPGYVKATLNQGRVAAVLTADEVELAMDVLEDLKTPVAQTDVLAASLNEDDGE